VTHQGAAGDCGWCLMSTIACFPCALMQVHVRTKPCYGRQDVSCNCAVAMREGNHVLGVYACDADKPPVAIHYLDDPLVPGAGIRITPSGRTYTVNDEFRYALKCSYLCVRKQWLLYLCLSCISVHVIYVSYRGRMSRKEAERTMEWRDEKYNFRYRHGKK